MQLEIQWRMVDGKIASWPRMQEVMTAPRDYVKNSREVKAKAKAKARVQTCILNLDAVSRALGHPQIYELKSKWRGIRDYYVKELKTIPKPRSGDSSDVISRSNWRYLRQLSFLNDTLLTRDRVTNIVSTLGQHDSEYDAHYSSEKYPSDTMHGRTTQYDYVLDELQLERNESPGPSQMMPQNDDDDEEGTQNMQKEKITNSKQVLQYPVCSSNERKRTAKRKLDDCRQEFVTLESKKKLNY